MNIGFPEASVSFNRGQDILYRQFNDIDVYVEDAGKERLYFQLFKNLLPGINLAKIFSLGGKNNVTSEAAINSADKRKIYLVDLDFDGILGRKKNIRNLIYLHRYSIENYFIEEQTIKEQIRERKPSISDAEIASKFDYTEEYGKLPNIYISLHWLLFWFRNSVLLFHIQASLCMIIKAIAFQVVRMLQPLIVFIHK